MIMMESQNQKYDLIANVLNESSRMYDPFINTGKCTDQ